MDKTLKRLRSDLGKLNKVAATRRLTLRQLVAAAFDDIEIQLLHHSYERLALAFEEAGRPISVSSLAQYHRAERRARDQRLTAASPVKEPVVRSISPPPLRKSIATDQGPDQPASTLPPKVRLKSKRPT